MSTQPVATTVPDVIAAPPATVAPFRIPDVTARPLTTDDLRSMLPPGATGVAATDDGPTISVHTNEALISGATLDREDEASDLGRHGRLTGVWGQYSVGTHEAHVWIDVLRDADAAHGYLTDAAGDITKRIGGTHVGAVGAVSAEEFPVAGIGQEAIGLEVMLDGSDERRETLILSRLGRLVVFSSVVREVGAADDRVPVQYLAEEVHDLAMQALLGNPAAARSSTARAPEGYAFEFERIVTIGEQRWVIAAEGMVAGADLSCRVRMQGFGQTVDRDMVRVGGAMWARDHGRPGYTPVGTGNALDAPLVAFCPAWPVDTAVARLVPSGEPARHSLAGVAAHGYRGTVDDVADSVGAPLDAVTVEVFNYWIADDAPWILEINLVASGPTLSMAALVGPGLPEGTATVTIRQQITSIGDTTPILPPT